MDIDADTSRRRSLSIPFSPAWLALWVVLMVALATARLQWPLDDFFEYWAAGRLNAAGHNPYEAAAVLVVQRSIGWQQPAPVLMYNPPWLLALAMPLGALPFGIARSVWLTMQVVMMLWCASRLWILYGGPPRYVVRACIAALLWTPTLLAFRMGQITTVILVGLVGVVWMLERGRAAAAGAMFALTAVKPQLVPLVGVPLLLWIVAERKWNVLAGAVACLGAASAVAAAANPAAFRQYVDLMIFNPPTDMFASPNAGTVLRLALHTRGTWPQYVPTVVGAAIVAVWWWRRRVEWDWRREMPVLVIVSMLATSYGGWTFDLVLLLVPILALAALATRVHAHAVVGIGSLVFLVISIVAYVMLRAEVVQFAFIWMTPAVAVAYWILMHALHRRGYGFASVAAVSERSGR